MTDINDVHYHHHDHWCIFFLWLWQVFVYNINLLWFTIHESVMVYSSWNCYGLQFTHILRVSNEFYEKLLGSLQIYILRVLILRVSKEFYKKLLGPTGGFSKNPHQRTLEKKKSAHLLKRIFLSDEYSIYGWHFPWFFILAIGPIFANP